MLSSIATTTHAQDDQVRPSANVSFIQIEKDITLRRMVVGNANPKGTVLFLHGFPETMYAWNEASLALAYDYEVHAFDWPGYGFSSRPTADRFSYAPMDCPAVLEGYIEKAHIDRSRLTIYGTDIGALPALLQKEMGKELAERIGAELSIFPNIGHYPHLQDLERTVEEVRASFR
jgi:pimeloyl-ACP methyl ester carboxylesterase